ncbi:MAG: endopeptidase La [Verrucomicrobia bacterium]|nr:endopeptidase La [Verrucomicrobiota bacterium]
MVESTLCSYLTWSHHLLGFTEELDPETDLDDAILSAFEEADTSSKKALSFPDHAYVFPITKRPFFPGMAAPIMIEQGPYYEALKAIAKQENKFIGLVLTKEETADLQKISFDDLHHTGVIARILRIIPMEQGGAQVILNMEKRMSVQKPIKNHKCLYAKVVYHQDEVLLNKELKAYAISIISTIKELLKLNPLFKEELQIFLSHSDFTEPGKLADFAVALTTATREELQDVLETLDIPERIGKALVLLKKELDLSKLQNTINQKIEITISKSQKEFYLREQLKTIKKELGLEKDEKTSDREKFEARLKKCTVPKDVQTVINEELEKLSSLEPQSPEYALSRNYLDWLTVVPWGIKSPDIHNLAEAEQILEEDHHGLEDLKQRILEFISVAKLSGSLRGSIMCLVGPPGVGKTSIGKSIARALNRKFFRFSVGGMRDEAEVKGHRRTYIGAMPGKILQALKFCQTMNPVIMIDEVDKIGSSFHGDPASALLEVLDPEQNSEFLDHYLDVRCNLSDILFIVTANILDTVPEPLVDRMEIMRLSGYILEEKLEIAKRYLIPKNRKIMGLKAAQVSFTPPALKQLINGYAREAGVRTLENNIKKILRKVALKITREQESHLPRKKKKKAEKELPPANAKGTNMITPDSLQKYLGKPVFHTDRFYERTPIGVCAGLAWTSLGGATLYIESIRIPAEKTEMKLTGQAGPVMKESSEIAWSYLHGSIHKYALGCTFFEKSQVHIHIPEGATPKDGPSAGVTMVTSLLSLLKNTPITEDLCMTGELTLTGRILPIGGVKEKLIAAKRSGLQIVALPKDNLRDVDELPEYVKKGLTIHFVEHYDEIYKLAFPESELPAI